MHITIVRIPNFHMQLEAIEVVLDPTISVDELVKAAAFTNYERHFVRPQYVSGSLAHVEIPEERQTVSMAAYGMETFHSLMLRKDLGEMEGFRLSTAFEILSYLAANPKFYTNHHIPALRDDMNTCDFEVSVGWCGNDFVSPPQGQDFKSIDANCRMFHNEHHGGATIFLTKIS